MRPALRPVRSALLPLLAASSMVACGAILGVDELIYDLETGTGGSGTGGSSGGGGTGGDGSRLATRGGCPRAPARGGSGPRGAA